MATLNSFYVDATNSLGSYLKTSSTTTSTAYPYQYVGGQLGSGLALFGGAQMVNSYQQLGVPYPQEQKVQKPKSVSTRIIDQLRSEMKDWCGDVLVMA